MHTIRWAGLLLALTATFSAAHAQDIREAARQGDAAGVASLLEQGHVLDLLARRDEAVARYQRVVNMDLDGGTRHDQYGLAFSYTPYAQERIEAPFERVENALP